MDPRPDAPPADDTQGSPARPAPLRLHLLGAASLARTDGQRLLLSACDAALLALLQARGTLERSQLAAWLWPDVAPPQAQRNLRQRLFRLNRWAGAPVVAGDRRRLAWSPACVVDVDAWPSAFEAGQAPLFSELLATHDYADLPAVAEQVDRLRAEHRARCQDSLAARAEAHAARGELALALQHAEQLVQMAPLLEHAHRRVMHLHARRGDQAAALAAYRRCTQLLTDALAMPPSAETRALAAQIEAAALPPAPAGPRRQLLHPPVLVGPDAPRQMVQAALTEGRSLWVMGHAGEGKTRLLTALCATQPGWVLIDLHPGDQRLRHGLLARMLDVLQRRFGACPDETARAVLIDLVDRPGRADLATPDPGAAATGVPRADAVPWPLRQALVQGLAGWQRAGLAGLVVDDLHHADAASLDLLGAAIGRLGLPCLVATRPTGAPVPAWAAAWPVLHLPPWPVDDIVSLLDTLALPGVRGHDWARALHRRTGGNPGFLLQTLSTLHGSLDLAAAGDDPAPLPSADAWAATLPPELAAAVDAQLAALPPDARALVRLAAVAGPDFTLRLAAQVTDRPLLDLADAWVTLERARLMAGDGFAHDLAREAAGRATPAALATLLHADVARVLARDGAPPVRVAWHWAQAGDWSAAAQAYDAAALAAEASSDVPAQQAALDEAVHCRRREGSAEALRAAFDGAYQALGLCLTAQALQEAEARAQALQAAADSPRQRAMALEALARVRLEQQAPGDALPLARQALALADAVADPVLALRARRRAASACMQQGLSDQALALVSGVETQLQHLAPAERVQWQLEHAAVLDYADRRRDALPHYAQALATARQLGQWAVMADALSSQSLTLMTLGRQAQAMAALEESMVMSRRAGLGEAALLVDRMSLAGHWRDAGWFGRYLAVAEPLPQALRDAGMVFWALNAENDLGMAYLWLGRVDLAWRCFGPVPDDAPAVMRAARLLMLARGIRDYGLRQPLDPAQLVARAQALLEAAGGTGRSHVRLRLALERTRDAPAAEALAAGAAIEAEALARDNLMLAANAAMQQLRVLASVDDDAALPGLAPTGRRAHAAEVARSLLARLAADGPPASVYPPELWWLCHGALAPVAPAEARAVHARAWAWLSDTARHEVPDLFRETFWSRNPVNLAWRTLGPPP